MDSIRHSHATIHFLASEVDVAFATRKREKIIKKMQNLELELREHIHKEEDRKGLFDLISEQEPNLSPHLKRMKSQHKNILVHLDSMLYKEDLNLEELQSQYKACLALVHDHEKEEDYLIREAFYKDTPSGID